MFRQSQKVAIMSPNPANMPISGEMTMKISVFVQPPGMMTLKDMALAMAAPA